MTLGSQLGNEHETSMLDVFNKSRKKLREEKGKEK